MSTKYKEAEEVPDEVICKRLEELSEAVVSGKPAINREFNMRIPAELDRDPDLVLSIAGRRLTALSKENEELRAYFAIMNEAIDKVRSDKKIDVDTMYILPDKDSAVNKSNESTKPLMGPFDAITEEEALKREKEVQNISIKFLLGLVLRADKENGLKFTNEENLKLILIAEGVKR